MNRWSVIPVRKTNRKTITEMSLIFVRILLVISLCRNGFGNSRINQGTPIDITNAPYMARVRIKLSPTVGFACDGSILSDSYILTAGHCRMAFLFKKLNFSFLQSYHLLGVTDESNINVSNPPLFGPSNFSILVGATDLDYPDQGEAHDVSKVFFREFSTKNDLAMFKLSTKINLDGKTKKAVTLPNNMFYSPKNRTDAHVDGWGTNPQNSENLLRANIYTISVQECNTGADVGRDRTYQICTSGLNGAGPCKVSLFKHRIIFEND